MGKKDNFYGLFFPIFTSWTSSFWNTHSPMKGRLLVYFNPSLLVLSDSAAAAAAAAAAKSLQSCPTLCDPIDGSPPGSPVPGILQARTLEWVALSFSF